MRHRVYGKHLGRNKDTRDNLFRGLVQTLLTHGTIQTSEAKAKAVKGLVDKVISLAKDKQRENRLQAFVTDKNLRERLVKEIVPKLGTRTSGFTRIVRMGTRVGDQTSMVRMSIIGAEELKPIKKEAVKSAEVKEEKVKKVEKAEAIDEKKSSVRRSVKTATPRRRVAAKASK